MDSQSIKNELFALAERLNQLANLIANSPVHRANEGFPSHKLQLVNDKICLRCNEPIKDGELGLRGNHSRCYKATDRQIKAGEFTDAEAVEAGLLMPPGKPGRKANAEKLDILDQIKEVRRRKEERANGDSQP